MGDDSPGTKNISVRVPRPKISKDQMGKGAPQRGEIQKVPHPQNFRTPFSRKIVPQHISKISGMKGDRSVCQQPELFSLLMLRNCVIIKSINFYFGGLAPKFDLRPHVTQNLSRARREAHDPEKILEIARTVVEKIEFKKKNFGAT